nr:hypothetical protein [Rhodoferax sp. PAMC 29310]
MAECAKSSDHQGEHGGFGDSVRYDQQCRTAADNVLGRAADRVRREVAPTVAVGEHVAEVAVGDAMQACCGKNARKTHPCRAGRGATAITSPPTQVFMDVASTTQTTLRHK